MKHRKKREKTLVYPIVFILISLALILAVTISFSYLFLRLYEKSELENNTVVNVIDGDTFEYYDKDSNAIKTVRLLCVNAPEKDEEGYEEAKAFLEELVFGKQVILEKDISETDKYGRLLRYAYLEDRTFVNELIVKNSHGEILIIEPDTKRCGEMD